MHRHRRLQTHVLARCAFVVVIVVSLAVGACKGNQPAASDGGEPGTCQSGQSESRRRFLSASVAKDKPCVSEDQTRTCVGGVWGAWSGSYAAETCGHSCDGGTNGATETRTRYQTASLGDGATCKSETQTRTCADGVWGNWSGSYAAETCGRSCDGGANGAVETRTRYQAATVTAPATCISEEQTRTCSDGSWGEWSGTYGALTCTALFEICTPGAVGCIDAHTAGVCDATGTAWQTSMPCENSGTCEHGGCVAGVAWHLQRSVDLQFLQDGDPGELDRCAANAADDRAAGRLLCDAWHALLAMQPRFALFYGNSWVMFDPGSSDPCSNTATALSCRAKRLKDLTDRIHARLPHLLLSAHLAEFIYRGNVPEGQYDAICKAGSAGNWGANTCIPDVANSQAARDYLVAWGKTFIDGGVRAMQFGQARMIAGDGGNNSVSTVGAQGMVEVMTRIRSYAAERGVPVVFFGAQAATSVKLGVDGPEQIDYVMGAQHLEVVKEFLLQPLNQKGGFLNGRYGSGDWHDANWLNNANGLPVVLDYDNWSNRADFPDDIRHLAMLVDNDRRVRTIKDHVRNLQLYNPRASLSVPISKILDNNTGLTCYGVNQTRFSADACGLIPAVQELWAAPDRGFTAGLGEANPPLRRDYWGQQLRGRDETVAWFYLAFLGRRTAPDEYSNALAALPAIMDDAKGARLTWAKAFITSPEFAARNISDDEFVNIVYRAILLREPDSTGKAFYLEQLAKGLKDRAQVLGDIAYSSEAAGLYAP